MSVIQPLYFTTLKCRNRDTRYRAIELFRKCGKEGVWEGNVMARVAEYVVDQEESRRYVDRLSGKREILERDRICGISVNLMRAEKKVLVQCSERKWTHSETGMSSWNQKVDQAYVWEFSKDTLEL
jgi:hypothetical protein